MTDVPVTLIVCGAPLAARTPDLAGALIEYGWRVSVVGTPAARWWMDEDAVSAMTGRAPTFDFRDPNDDRCSADPAAVIVCPATFNTVNKAAIGAADTYALSVIASAVACRVPLVVAPMVSTRLWDHPAFQRNLAKLGEWGAVLIDVTTGAAVPAPVQSGMGADAIARFDPSWITGQLALKIGGP